MRLILVMIGLVVGLFAGFYFGWEFGQYQEAHREFEQRYRDDRERIDPVLAANPAFRRLTMSNFPVAGICLGGPVATREDYNRLRAEMVRIFGESRIANVMYDVFVERVVEAGAAPDRGR